MTLNCAQITGGIGRERLTKFYRYHFIWSNPKDSKIELISRTVGIDRVIDEFIFCITHDEQVDWLYFSLRLSFRIYHSTNPWGTVLREFRQPVRLFVFPWSLWWTFEAIDCTMSIFGGIKLVVSASWACYQSTYHSHIPCPMDGSPRTGRDWNIKSQWQGQKVQQSWWTSMALSLMRCLVLSWERFRTSRCGFIITNNVTAFIWGYICSNSKWSLISAAALRLITPTGQILATRIPLRSYIPAHILKCQFCRCLHLHYQGLDLC